MTRTSRILIATVGGVAFFFGLAWAIRTGAARFDIGKLGAHAVLKLALIAISFGVWAASRRDVRALGWARSSKLGRSARRWYLLTAAGMGSATLVMIFSGARHPLTAGLSLPQLILSIWLLSSVAEEIFVRGLLQSWMGGASGADIASRPVVAASAATFASMHVPLIWSGAGWVGGGAIVCATFVVGWAAAELRGRSGSLLHPILVHVFGNVIAVPFGVIGVLAYRAIYGVMPAIAG